MSVVRCDAPSKVRLDEIPTNLKDGLDRAGEQARFAELAAELSELQELLTAAGTHGLLVVLQGRDAAGKDGTLRAVAGAMNPVGTRIASFKVPTPDETAHDFLWRVHRQVPGRGEVVFFNRSHYEDVLVVRVHDLVPVDVWKRRYDHINAFERLLADSGILVVKFLLHISRDEQEKRLLAREQDPEKAWKLNPGDWRERALWERYTEAYDDAVGRCASPHAPWIVVPADDKGERDIVVAEALVQTLRPYKRHWEASLAALGERQRAALAELREEA